MEPAGMCGIKGGSVPSLVAPHLLELSQDLRRQLLRQCNNCVPNAREVKWLTQRSSQCSPIVQVVADVLDVSSITAAPETWPTARRLRRPTQA